MLNRGFGFGGNSGSAFGSNNSTNNNSSAFGAQNTANNSSAGVLFGNNNSNSTFGNAATPSASTSGFGGFGQNTSTSPFGANNTNNTTNTASGGLFGAKPASSAGGGFGSSFGASTNPVSSPFGATGSSFGAANTSQNTNQQQSGTGLVPFQPFSEKDASKPLINNVYQSISAMPQYQNYSFEELRFQDYLQNRRYGDGSGASVNTNAASSSPFGATSTNNTATGSGGLFGSNSTNSATSPFGQNNSTPGGLFNKPATSGGLFGGQPSGSTTGSSAFGSTATGSTFGSNTNSTSPFGQNTNTGNAFGQSPANASSFGQPQQQNTFGATTNQTTSPFGQNNSATKPFGSSFGTNTTGSTGGGLFGNNNATSNTSGGLFGSTNNNNTGASATSNASPFGGGGFGTTNNTAGSGFSLGGTNNSTTTSTNSFGGFGQSNNAAKPALSFGQNNTSTTAGGGLFGGTNTASTSSPFGATNTANTGGLFGAKPATTTATATTGFGFGNSTAGTAAQPTSGGLFGNINTAQTASAGGLFGAKPAGSTSSTIAPAGSTGGLFGAKPSSSGGLFGSSLGASQASSGTGFGGGLNTANNTNTGGSLFGANNNNASTGSSLFGNTNNATSNTSGGLFGGSSLSNGSTFGNNNVSTSNSGGLFGNSMQQSQNQQQRVAQIDQQPFGNSPLFQQQQPSPNAANGSLKLLSTPLSTTPLKKKHGGLVSAYKMVPRPLYSPARNGNGTPRGRAVRGANDFDSDDYFDLLDESNGSRPGSTPTSSLKTKKSSTPLSGKSNENTSVTDEALLRSHIKKNSLASGSDDVIIQAQSFTPKSSMRRLIIDRALQRDDSEGSISKLILPTEENNGEQNSVPESRQPVEERSLSPPVAPVEIKQVFSVSAAEPEKSFQRDEDIVDDNGYWISPRQDKLRHMPLKELRHVENFRVGRKGVGQVTFIEPVDLSNFSDYMKQIPGRIVVLSHRSCTLYPEESNRPTTGQDLNVKTKITLSGMWPRLKDSSESVKDPNHPLYNIHVNRLKRTPNTKFVSYDVASGSWTFIASPI